MRARCLEVRAKDRGSPPERRKARAFSFEVAVEGPSSPAIAAVAGG